MKESDARSLKRFKRLLAKKGAFKEELLAQLANNRNKPSLKIGVGNGTNLPVGTLLSGRARSCVRVFEMSLLLSSLSFRCYCFFVNLERHKVVLDV